MKYLLDTSALLAHFFEEPGAARVQEILEDKEAKVYLSAVTIAEFARRLNNLETDSTAARTIALEYAGLANDVIPVDTAVSTRAFEIGASCTSRLPLIDALIASCAHTTDAVLVHCDPHFDAIPETFISCRHI